MYKTVTDSAGKIFFRIPWDSQSRVASCPGAHLRSMSSGAGSSEGGAATGSQAAGGKSSAPSLPLTSADLYFDANAHFATHEELLKDRARMRAFATAILKNKKMFAGKTVLDIGAGTCVMSLLAARAGAKHVYAVEAAAIAEVGRTVVKANGYADRITVIHSRIEDAKLPVESVDIIVCDWMGYFLVHDSIISSVLFARDRYLCRKSGLIFPDRATLRIFGIEDGDYKDQRVGFWDNVYGFNMSCMRDGAISEPLIDSCNPSQVATSACDVMTIDIRNATIASLARTKAEFTLSASRKDFIHALVLYFQVQFPDACATRVSMSTGPDAEDTHWKQAVLYLDEALPVNKGETVRGSIEIVPAGFSGGEPSGKKTGAGQIKKKKQGRSIIKLQSQLEGESAAVRQSRTYAYASC